MSEYIRSVRVRVEVDTNKQTRTLDKSVELDEVETVIRDFIQEWKP